MRPVRRRGRARRRAAGRDEGMVTAETAMALPALLLVLAFALTVEGVVSTHSACLDAARAGARAAARGDSDAIVDSVVRRVLPRATSVGVAHATGLVTVTVSARPAGLVPRLPVPDVVVASTADDEATS